MEFTLIDSAEAPARMPRRAKWRDPKIEALVAALEPGKVARIAASDRVRGRQIAYKIMQSAARQRKLVDVWEVGGIMYAELAKPDDQA